MSLIKPFCSGNQVVLSIRAEIRLSATILIIIVRVDTLGDKPTSATMATFLHAESLASSPFPPEFELQAPLVARNFRLLGVVYSSNMA
jgi:hypothetical protein